MAIALVTSTPAANALGSSGASIAVTLGASAAVGDTIICGVIIRDSDGVNVTGVSDPSNGAYSPMITPFAATTPDARFHCYSVKVTSAGAPSITASFDGSAFRRTIHVAAFTGIADSPGDKTGTGEGNSSTIQSSSMSPAEDNELIWGFATSNAGVPAVAGVFTSLISEATNLSRTEYEIQTTATARTTDFSTGGADTWGTIGVTFKQAAAGGGSRPMFRGQA